MQIPDMVARLRSADTAERTRAIVAIRQALSIGKLARRRCQPAAHILHTENTSPIREVIEAGGLPPLVHILQQGDPDEQFEAAWALNNVASGNHEQCAALFECV